MGWLLTAFRRLRLEWAATFGTVLLVLVTALLFALAPRALDRVGDEALRDEIGGARAAERNIQLLQEARIPAGRDAPDVAGLLEPIVQQGDTLEAELPAAVRALVADRSVSITTVRYELLKQTSDPAFLRFRYQTGVEDRIRIVDGRPPTSATREVDGVGPDELVDISSIEAVVSRATADGLDLTVGESVEMSIDYTDPLVGRGGQPEAVVIDVVGIYEINDVTDDWWLNDTLAAMPSIRFIGGDARVFDVDVLVAAEAYPVLLQATARTHYPLRYAWNLYVDPGRLDSASVDRLLVDLRRAQATYPAANVSFGNETAMRGGLLRLVERQRASWLAAQSILTVVGIGPAAVASAAVGLIVLLAAQRRRAAMALSRGRGASIGQVVVAVAAEGLLIAVPAVVAAAALAVLLVPTGPNVATAIAAAGVALVTVLLVLASSVPGTASAARGPTRESSLRRIGPRRLVGELGIVVLAIGGAYLLRERGVRGASSTGELAAADPLVAAVPALAGIAAGIVAVRLYPLPVRLLAWLAALRRDLVPILAMRRSIHGGTSAPVLIVLLATVAIGGFSAASLVHLDRAAEAVAWQSVGAPYRVNSPGGSFPGDFDPAGLPRVEASADVFRTAIPIGLNGPRHEFVAIDVDDLEAVVGGTPADPRLPDALRGAGPGASAPVPVVISRSLAVRPDGVELGEVFQVTIEAYTFQVQAVDVRESFPWIPPNLHFVVAASDQLRTVAPPIPLAAGSAILRAPGDAADEIRAAVAQRLPGATLEDRLARTDALRTAPAVEAIRTGIGASAAVSALYAALAVAAALALAGILRAIEVAHLRTLGLTRREAFALVVVEHGPTVLVAFGVGLAFGLGLFALLRPGLGLDGLVGASVDVPVGIDAAQLGIIIAAMIAIVAVGLTLGAWFQRNAAPVAAVRRGFE
jgi:putative ABC transport system permease protein